MPVKAFTIEGYGHRCDSWQDRYPEQRQLDDFEGMVAQVTHSGHATCYQDRQWVETQDDEDAYGHDLVPVSDCAPESGVEPEDEAAVCGDADSKLIQRLSRRVHRTLQRCKRKLETDEARIVDRN